MPCLSSRSPLAHSLPGFLLLLSHARPPSHSSYPYTASRICQASGLARSAPRRAPSERADRQTEETAVATLLPVSHAWLATESALSLGRASCVRACVPLSRYAVHSELTSVIIRARTAHARSSIALKCAFFASFQYAANM